MCAAQAQASEESAAPLEPIRWVLSLDGGGVRGLSSLLILKELLSRGQTEDGITETHQPFDLVCGTSVGGLSAIMIGRMNKSIQDCENKFIKLSQEVFGRPRLCSKLLRLLKPKHDAQRLINATNALAQDLQPDNRMHCTILNDRKRQMHAYVVCADAGSESPNSSVLLGTTESIQFRPGDETRVNCEVWEAVRATSAAPTYFNPQTIQIEETQYKLLDGGLCGSNPIHTTSEVTKHLGWGEQEIGYVSIGTGISNQDAKQVKNYWKKSIAISALGNIPGTPAADLRNYLKRTQQSFSKLLNDARTNLAAVNFRRSVAEENYFRFNCDITLDGYELVMSKLDGVKDLEKIASITKQYLGETDTVEIIRLARERLRI